MEELKKFKHYATDEIIEVSVCDGCGFVNGTFFDIIESDRSRLKGTGYFEVIESDGANI